MRIVLCFLLEVTCICVNTAKIGCSKGDRLGHFRNYHNIHTNLRSVPNRPKWSTQVETKLTKHTLQRSNSPKIHTIRDKICTAKICSKCIVAFRYRDIAGEKIQTYCLRILKLHNCCPIKLLLRSGF